MTNYACLMNGWIDLFIDYTGTGCLFFNVPYKEPQYQDAGKLQQILNNSLDDSEDRLKLLHKLSNEVETLRFENKDYVRTIKNRDSALAKIKKEKKTLTDTLELIKEKITSLSKEIEM